jgi:hypothetical protein
MAEMVMWQLVVLEDCVSLSILEEMDRDRYLIAIY